MKRKDGKPLKKKGSISTLSTAIKKQAILKSLKNGSFVSTACKEAGIDRGTFYNWCIADKKFYEAVEESKQGQIGVAEDSLYKNVLAGNVTAQIFFLCNRARGKWQNVSKVEQTLSIKTLPQLAREVTQDNPDVKAIEDKT